MTRSTLRAASPCSMLWTSRGLPRKGTTFLSGMLREPARAGTTASTLTPAPALPPRVGHAPADAQQLRLRQLLRFLRLVDQAFVQLLAGPGADDPDLDVAARL